MNTIVKFAPTKSKKILQSVRGSRVLRVRQVPGDTNVVEYPCLANSTLQLLENGEVIGTAELSINVPRELILGSPGGPQVAHEDKIKQAEAEGRRAIQLAKLGKTPEAKAKAEADAKIAEEAEAKAKEEAEAKAKAEAEAKAKAAKAKAEAEAKVKAAKAKAEAEVKQKAQGNTDGESGKSTGSEAGSGSDSVESNDV